MYNWTNSNVVMGSDTTNGGPDDYTSQHQLSKGDRVSGDRNKGDKVKGDSRHDVEHSQSPQGTDDHRVNRPSQVDKEAPKKPEDEAAEPEPTEEATEEAPAEEAPTEETVPAASNATETATARRRVRRDMKALLPLDNVAQAATDDQRLAGNTLSVGQTFIHTAGENIANGGLVLGNLPTIAGQHACSEQLKTFGVGAGFASLVVLALVIAGVRKCCVKSRKIQLDARHGEDVKLMSEV